MASRTPPPARPIPDAPNNATEPLNEVAVKQAQNNVISDIVAENDAQGVRTYNFSPNASPEEMKAVAGKAKAALGLPPVIRQSAEKGAQGRHPFFCRYRRSVRGCNEVKIAMLPIVILGIPAWHGCAGILNELHAAWKHPLKASRAYL